MRDSLSSPVFTAFSTALYCTPNRPLPAVVRRRLEQFVHAGLEGQHRHAVVAVLVAYALHAERVGDHDAVVVELVAQDAGEDRLGQRRRVTGRVQRGTMMCAVMIESTPCAMSALNGGRSSCCHCSFVWLMIGTPVWLSVSVSPWPGKCLAVGITPAAW